MPSTSWPSSRPSVRRNPTASSASLPGVRIVTATATGSWRGPAARISSGASPTTRSSRTSSDVAADRHDPAAGHVPDRRRAVAAQAGHVVASSARPNASSAVAGGLRRVERVAERGQAGQPAAGIGPVDERVGRRAVRVEHRAGRGVGRRVAVGRRVLAQPVALAVDEVEDRDGGRPDGRRILRLGRGRQRRVEALDRRPVVVDAERGTRRRPAAGRRSRAEPRSRPGCGPGSAVARVVPAVGSRRGRRRAADGGAVEVAAGTSPPDPVGSADGTGARPGRAMASAAITSTITTPPPSSTRRRVTSETSVRARDPGGDASGPYAPRCHHGGVLADDERAFLATARRAVLGTIAPDGRPRLVPICFVLAAERAGPLLAARRQAEAQRRSAGAGPRPRHRRGPAGDGPRRSLGRGLVAARLAALRRQGEPAATSSAAGHGDVVAALRAKYPQYATHRLEDRPLIRIEIERVTSWGLGDRS